MAELSPTTSACVAQSTRTRSACFYDRKPAFNTYHGARWMAPQGARWLSPDPATKGPDRKHIIEFWALHPYQYVNQNPLVFWDPNGEDAAVLTGAVVFGGPTAVAVVGIVGSAALAGYLISEFISRPPLTPCMDRWACQYNSDTIDRLQGRPTQFEQAQIRKDQHVALHKQSTDRRYGNNTASPGPEGPNRDTGPRGVLNQPVRKVVNSNMGHAAERAVERAKFASEKEARRALQERSQIQKNGLPSGTVRDTAHNDRVIVPGFGQGGAVVYQVKDGTLKLKTVLDGGSRMTEREAGSTGFVLRVSDDDNDVAYLRLPSHPGGSLAKLSKSVRLADIMGPYRGPDIVLDFDVEGVLVGIEILA